MGQDVLLKSVEGYVGTLVLNRPEKRNSLSPELLLELHLALSTWAVSEEVRCVVITGAGDKSFSSGYDITSIPTDLTPEMEDLIRNHNPLELAFNSVKSFPMSPAIKLIGMNTATETKVVTTTAKPTSRAPR